MTGSVVTRRTTVEWVALAVLLVATAALYLVNPSINGWANQYYSAAAQAGSTDWTAFLYGSSDAANSITVDKAPAGLWPIALSVRLLGLTPFAIMVPQAVLGVATVGVLYATVRRGFPAVTALCAAGLLAITPVATLMFRYNNPDALLVFLVTAATYFTVRGIQSARTGWMLLAGAAVGLGFLAKELQAFLVLPALAITYLVAAPTPWWKRMLHLLAAAAGLIIAAGWWVAIVELVPPASRPYIGGSQSNSFLEVVFGYNGIGRITGGAYGNGLSQTSIDRLLSGQVAGQIGWLLPTAIVLLVVAATLLSPAPRTSLPRAILFAFGGSLVVTGLALSFMSGIFHSYYTLELVPAIAAVVAIGVTCLWRARGQLRGRIVLAMVTVGSAVWAFAILARAANFAPGLGAVVVGLGVASAILLLTSSRSAAGVALVFAVASLSLGPLAYSLDTANSAHSGSGPAAGPNAASARASTLPLTPAQTATLSIDGGSYRWLAATVGSTPAAGLQLALGHPVMPLGGYKHTDPSPTLAQFQAFVAAKQIHWFFGGSPVGGSEASQISRWVRDNFTRMPVDGVAVYDLTEPPVATTATDQL